MAEENKYNILIESGADFVLPFTWYDNNGNPYDLTGATIEGQLRETPSSADGYDFICTHNGAGGRITITLPYEITSDISFSYGVYDVFVNMPGGGRKRPLYGEVEVQDHVTKPHDGAFLYMIGATDYESLPAEGITDRLYFVYGDRKIYRWNGSNYIATSVGNGIQKIEFVEHVDDFSDKYRITYDDSTTFEYIVTSKGIDYIEKVGSTGTPKTGVIDQYRIHFNNDTTHDYYVTNGRAFDVKTSYDSTQAYEYLDMVKVSGATYVAVQDVPEDTAITNTSYWLKIIAPLTMGTVTTVGAQELADASIGGTADAPVLNLTIPRGVTGNESIDDTKGEGDTDYVWSADKTYADENAIFIKTYLNITNWEQGRRSGDSGYAVSDSSCCRTTNIAKKTVGANGRIYINPPSGLKVQVLQYSSSSPSDYDGEGLNWTQGKVEFKADPNKYYAYNIRLSGGTLSPSDLPENGVESYVYSLTDESLSIAHKSADAKATGDRISDRRKSLTEYILGIVPEKTTDVGYVHVLENIVPIPLKKVVVAEDCTLHIRSKNICSTANPASASGVTISKVYNDDGTLAYYSLSGTATAGYTKQIGNFMVKAGETYYVLGASDYNSTHRVSLGTSSGGGTFLYVNSAGASFTATEDRRIYMNVNIAKNAVLSDFRAYPMVTIRKAPTEYEPNILERTCVLSSGENNFEDMGYIVPFADTAVIFALDGDTNFVQTQITYGEKITEDVSEDISEIFGEIDRIDRKILGITRQERYAFRIKIPDYFLDNGSSLYLSDKIAEFNALSGDDKFTFWTDSHWLWSAKKTMPIIGYVNNWCNISKTIYGGDILGNGSSSTKAEAQYLLHQHQDQVKDVFPNNWYYAFGNHDLNQSGGISGITKEEFLARALSFKEVYDNCVKPYENDGQVFPDTNPTYPAGTEYYYWNRLHYYFDNTDSKIRYIVLNSGTPHNPLYNEGVSPQIITESGQNELFLQEIWLYNVLMATPEEWGVIVIAHEFSGDLPNLDDSSKQIAEMLVAMKRKETCSVKSGSYTSPNEFDFTNAKAEVIMMLCGHCHYDTSLVCTLSEGTMSSAVGTQADENSVLCIFTWCDTRHNKDGMTLNTTNELAFDLFSIDRTEKKISTVRIGYGSNREFDY